MTRGLVPRHASGEEVRIGDRIMYAGHPGRVLFVVDTGEVGPRRQGLSAAPSEGAALSPRGHLKSSPGLA